MVTLSKIYTKTGDLGETGLGDGSRISKACPRITAIGAVDETNSAIGIARLDSEGDSEGRLRVSGAQVERLEREIDAMNEKLEPLRSFVLPGGTALAARLHLARAIVRRAEAAMVALAAEEKINEAALRYANRLSDHLFVMARTANNDGMGDVLWVPGKNR